MNARALNRIALVTLLLLGSCEGQPAQPIAASRIDYLIQTDGRRCQDGPPLQIERMARGNYLFLILYGGAAEVPFATITLQERSGEATTTIWSQQRVPHNAEDGSFAVFVPVGSLPNAKYQFTVSEVLNGKETYLGRFAFTLVESGEDLYGAERPCGGTP